MTRFELDSAYFDWIYQLVNNDQYLKHLSYRKLFETLYRTEFIYILHMDGNRAEDGIDIRYRFGYEYGVDDCVIAEGLDTRPCSVLEMLVALSIRCEENIMEDEAIGDRTGQWFWGMIASLGLGSMSDNRFDAEYVDYILDRFMNRKYDPDGRGGLFTLENPRRDLRNVEIWYQAMWYLDEIL